jgi:hypothetical protein
MKKNWFFLAAFAVLLFAVPLGFLLSSGRVALVTLNTRAKIEVNGTLVPGEVLEGRTTAVVTTRDAGKSHSYQLFFEGDTDSTGDMGFVLDCNQWVAPHLPLLLETREYPPCKNLPEDASQRRRWPLIDKGKSMQFVLRDRSVVTIRH